MIRNCHLHWEYLIGTGFLLTTPLDMWIRCVVCLSQCFLVEMFVIFWARIVRLVVQFDNVANTLVEFERLLKFKCCVYLLVQFTRWQISWEIFGNMLPINFQRCVRCSQDVTGKAARTHRGDGFPSFPRDVIRCQSLLSVGYVQALLLDCCFWIYPFN